MKPVNLQIINKLHRLGFTYKEFINIPIELNVDENTPIGSRVYVAKYTSLYKNYLVKYHKKNTMGYPDGGVEVYCANEKIYIKLYIQSVALHESMQCIKVVELKNEINKNYSFQICEPIHLTKQSENVEEKKETRILKEKRKQEKIALQEQRELNKKKKEELKKQKERLKNKKQKLRNNKIEEKNKKIQLQVQKKKLIKAAIEKKLSKFARSI